MTDNNKIVTVQGVRYNLKDIETLKPVDWFMDRVVNGTVLKRENKGSPTFWIVRTVFVEGIEYFVLLNMTGLEIHQGRLNCKVSSSPSFYEFLGFPPSTIQEFWSIDQELTEKWKVNHQFFF